jgi:hypothetical protein
MILGAAGDNNPSASEVRDRGGIIPLRWAPSFRNPWAQSSRYSRAASSESAEGYGYSRFCDLLRGFERRLTPVTRQRHIAGEKAFDDYSGKRFGIVDASTGEIREAEIFVGVLGPLTAVGGGRCFPSL